MLGRSAAGTFIMDTTKLTLRVDLGSGRALGPGKIRLLEAIEKTGSISQAGRKLGMSYRRAWLLVDDMNSCFRDPVIAAQPGGAHGGGATLTSFGHKLDRALPRHRSRCAGGDPQTSPRYRGGAESHQGEPPADLAQARGARRGGGAEVGRQRTSYSAMRGLPACGVERQHPHIRDVEATNSGKVDIARLDGSLRSVVGIAVGNPRLIRCLVFIDENLGNDKYDPPLCRSSGIVSAGSAHFTLGRLPDGYMIDIGLGMANFFTELKRRCRVAPPCRGGVDVIATC